MKEEKTKSKKRLVYYLILGISVLLLIAATALTVYFVTKENELLAEAPPIVDPGDNNEDPPVSDLPDPDVPGSSDQPGINEPSHDDQPSGGVTVKFVAPIDAETCSVEYNSIYANLTAKRWYRHKGVDFKADAGTDVKSLTDGVVTVVSVSQELGNLIVVDHGNGLQSYYRFVTPAENIAVGTKVTAGQKIGEVAEAYGSEAFDGTHLHVEVFLNGTPVDPMEYITPVLNEK